jgi:hypothetical protein
MLLQLLFQDRINDLLKYQKLKFMAFNNNFAHTGNDCTGYYGFDGVVEYSIKCHLYGESCNVNWYHSRVCVHITHAFSVSEGDKV